MKLVTLLTILILSVSCGKNGGSSSSSREEQQDGCAQGGRMVACETIEGADGNGIDLLETMIDVPVKISGTDVTFLSDKSSSTKGRRIACDTTVKNGEIYRVALRGDTLNVMTSKGNYAMKRLSDGDSLIGAWVSNEYDRTGAHVIRQMTFLSDSRVVMRTYCEL